MHITDLKHFLDSQGAISPSKGPARAMAQFQTEVVASATTTGTASDSPTCFKCRKNTVQTGLARDSAAVWKCPRCGTEGRISNWQGTLWDLRNQPAASV
jgi:ribosomal protein L37AE/L43A